VPPSCLVCRSPAGDLLYQLGQLSVIVCRECGQAYLHPLPSAAEIRSLFTRLYTTREGVMPELRSYYTYCFDDGPQNPLLQLYERCSPPSSDTVRRAGCSTSAAARAFSW
jgi:hypothetical protein